MLSQNPHIIYVDDDQDSCEMISFMLQIANNHYQVTTVSNVQKALSLIKSRTADLYIFDYFLPEMTGIELCQQIRQTDLQTPIIFYSAMAREVDRKEALAAGATEYLIKPDDLDRLTDTIKRLLDGNPSISKDGSANNKKHRTPFIE